MPLYVAFASAVLAGLVVPLVVASRAIALTIAGRHEEGRDSLGRDLRRQLDVYACSDDEA